MLARPGVAARRIILEDSGKVPERVGLPDDERRERASGKRYSIEARAAFILHKEPAIYELANRD